MPRHLKREMASKNYRSFSKKFKAPIHRKSKVFTPVQYAKILLEEMSDEELEELWQIFDQYKVVRYELSDIKLAYFIADVLKLYINHTADMTRRGVVTLIPREYVISFSLARFRELAIKYGHFGRIELRDNSHLLKYVQKSQDGKGFKFRKFTY